MVSTTASSPKRSRTSAAISSRPVASGNFLGALCVVARPPAHRRVALDLVLQLDDPVHQRLGPGRAAGDVDVHGYELVGALHDGVVVEHAGARGAGAHRDHPLRLEHLVVDAADDRRHLDRDAARQDDHVGLARGSAERLGAEPRDVVARGNNRHLLDGATDKAEGQREQCVGPPPVGRVLERRGEDPLLDVLLEIGALQVAAQQFTGAKLSRSETLPLYFQSSAPRRQTKARATSKSATKTRISPKTKTLLVAWTSTPTG